MLGLVLVLLLLLLLLLLLVLVPESIRLPRCAQGSRTRWNWCLSCSVLPVLLCSASLSPPLPRFSRKIDALLPMLRRATDPERQGREVQSVRESTQLMWPNTNFAVGTHQQRQPVWSRAHTALVFANSDAISLLTTPALRRSKLAVSPDGALF
jgi:hypothetical protein